MPAWLADVPSPVDAVLGTATMTMAECTRLEPGSVVRLKMPVGSDLEIRVGGVTFAYGEVVIREEAISLRVSRVAPPAPGDAE